MWLILLLTVLICDYFLRKNAYWNKLYDRYHNLRIILKQEKKEYVLEEPYPDDLADDASVTDRRAYEKHTNDS